MFRILVSPLNGDRSYWLPAMDVPAYLLTPAQIAQGERPVTFATDIDAAIVKRTMDVLIGARLDIIYKAGRK